MRRPLFVVCLCLVVLAGCVVTHTDTTGLDEMSCVATGRVYQKDTDCFYVNSVCLKQDAATQQLEIPYTENLICEYDKATEVLLGSTVKVSGTFRAFPQATNPGEFDTAGYYHSLQIGGKLQKVTILGASAEYSQWREILFQIREYFRERLYGVFPEKEASVMCAMLLGDKSELNKDVKALYQSNGIVHILSISGLHITIIGMSVYRLLRKLGLPVWLAAVCGGGILLLYGVMTGMSVSACRAIGMYLLRMLSEVVGRTYDMLTALGVMAVIVSWSNPGVLGNAGFYLSFGAVLGIGVLYPALMVTQEKKTVMKYEDHRWKQVLDRMCRHLGTGLKQSMLSGLSVTLFTLPIQLWFYYEAPTYSVLLNLLVLPFMSMVMMCGLLAMLVPGLGILGTIDCLVLEGYEFLCNCFEKLPFHTWNPGRPEMWQMLLYYLVLLGVVAIRNWWEAKSANGSKTLCGRKAVYDKGRLILAQIAGLTVAVIILAMPINKGTVITFLDVGQGDCICMQTASGEVYLFDCGSSSRSQIGNYVLKPYLKYMGISHIDAVFVSHSDSDHYNGVQELLTSCEEWGITVGQLMLPGDIRAGEGWQSGDITFTCLNPPADGSIEDSNADSQCFYIQIADRMSLLLTGDVEGDGEEALMQELQKRGIDEATILKVAHHGSRYSGGEAFLQVVRPVISVISCGENNSYGHPHEETLERLRQVGSNVLTTPKCGAITVEIGRNIKIKCQEYVANYL